MNVWSDGVKTIFKIIIGTIIAIVITSCIVELFNITLTSTFVRGIVTKSIDKSCDFFAQETYIRDDAGTATVYNVVKPIKFSSGKVAVSSEFFGSNATQQTIYERLYANSDDFRDFVKNYGKYWLNLRRLGYGICANYGGNGILSTSTPVLSSLSKTDKTAGDTYAKTFVTALNSGITYLDKEALTNISRWNMVANFYGGNPIMLKDADTKILGANGLDPYDYVLYDGYKVYFNTLNITDINYKVYDLTKTGADGADGFASSTNIGDVGYWRNTVGLDNNDERRYVCVADIDYEIKIGYDGITPIKKIFQWSLKQNNAMKERSTGNWMDVYSNLEEVSVIGDDVVNKDGIYFAQTDWNTASSKDYSLLDFNGKITYYIVR